MKTASYGIFFLAGMSFCACAIRQLPAAPNVVVVQLENSCSVEPSAPQITEKTPPQAEPTAPLVELVPVSTGLQGDLFYIPSGTQTLPDFSKLEAEKTLKTNTLNVTARLADDGYPGVDEVEWFGIDYHGTFLVDASGEYTFRLTADDGAELIIDGKKIISNDGIHPPTSKDASIKLSKGAHQIRVPYFQGPEYHIALVLEVAQSGKGFTLFDTDKPLGKL
jgi:hypothetical protein